MRSAVRSVQFASSDSGGKVYINISSYRIRHEPTDNPTVFPFSSLIKK